MKNLLCFCAFFCVLVTSFSQSIKIKAEKYPSLLWEITGKGLKNPSYLFGTMHVSSKMAFNLSDSFYLAIKNAAVVALETNPGQWQENFSRYDLQGSETSFHTSGRSRRGGNDASPQDYLSINSLQLFPYEKAMEAALSSNPSIINSFLYRSNSENSSDFEEDTYLDLHIFQTASKLGKKVCGVEDFDGSMRLVKEAYGDAAKEKKKARNVDYDDDFSYSHLEEAYRTGNLDLLDTINKVNSQSAAFDEKFLFRRNEIQAASIDSILKTGTRLFAGVGAAHLPGNRGVIEALRRWGYQLRPIKTRERDSHHKDQFENLRLPVPFTRQTADDGFYTVAVPGKLYNFGQEGPAAAVAQYADMVNGSYYMVARLATHAAILGQSEAQVLRKLDSVLYENIPGKILSKKSIVRNGYHGFDIVSRTRRGDVQRYNLFVTPFELLIFKMSGNGDYVKTGTEADQFFQSIRLKELQPEWKKWSPASGGFEVELPQQPLLFINGRQVVAAVDAATKTAMEVIRTDVHNYDFLEEDSFDLNLMEESFAASANISRKLWQHWVKVDGYPALDAAYKCNDSLVVMARYVIQGPHYYTLLASGKTENKAMTRFLHSFTIMPFVYGNAKPALDTMLQYKVQTPVALEKVRKLSLYGNEEDGSDVDDDDSLVDNGTYKSRLIACNETGEKIFVSFYKPSVYYARPANEQKDSSTFKKEWILRRQTTDTLANGMAVSDYELGKKQSSRMLKGRIVARDGVGYKLEALLDTLSVQSVFVRSFFQSFTPLDSLKETDVNTKKTALYFQQFFSRDSMLHKKAVSNLETIVFDSSDFSRLKQCVEALSWNEKNYLSLKKDLVGKFAFLETKQAADYLKTVYENAGDTVELQYAALDALLGQQTAYAYQTFGQLMQADPPVMNVNGGHDDDFYRGGNYVVGEEAIDALTEDGTFLDNLTDSLALTAGIVQNLLPLININDYEKPLMTLLGALVDSALVGPADYEAYLPKFLLEAKQALKKQQIAERTKSIEKAKQDDTNKAGDSTGEDSDTGNNKLTLYATLLLPFWERYPQVPLFVNQLLHSNDKRLKYNTALLLLRNHRPVADSLWQVFASLDDYRYPLFLDLQKIGRLSVFPSFYKSQVQLARSRLVTQQAFGRPDTLVFLQKLPVRYKEQNGVLYFFKYKEKKEDNAWKIATSGLFPQDSTQLDFSQADLLKTEEQGLDFTQLSTIRLLAGKPEGEQLEQLRKKLLYSHRKSAAQFYNDDKRFGDGDYLKLKY